MSAVARTGFLCAVVSLSVVAAAVAADPLGDLLPPQTRQLEKRSLLGGVGNDFEQRMYYRGGERGRPGAAFSADGKYLAVAHPYTGLAVWDLASGRNIGTFGSSDRSEGSTLAYSADGKHLVTVSWSGGRRGESYPVTLWDAKKREKIRSLDDDVNDTLFFSAAFAPDGKTLALGGGVNRRGGGAGNASVHFWDVETGDEIRHIDNLVPVDPAKRMSGIVMSLAYSPDGRTLALIVDGKVLLLELATSKVRTQIAVGPPLDQRMMEMTNEFPVGSVAFAPDGRTLAVGCQDGTVRRFDIPTGRELPPLTGHTSGIIALSFSTDGKTLRTLGSDQKLYFWSADANRDWRPKTIPPNEVALDRLWETLSTDDPLDLYGCSQLLAASPEPTVAFLRKRLKPVPVGDAARIDKLVADLQKAEYNDRKKAAKELREIGILAAPALRQLMERTGDDLARRLWMECESQMPPRERVRSTRALEVLEQIASDDARKLLEELAKGAPEAAFTIEVKATLARSAKGSGAGAVPKLEILWENLGSDDSAGAFQAARRLAVRPETAIPFLRDRLRELGASDAFDNDPKRVAKLLADLDSEEFDTRDKANKGLRTLGKLIEPALRKALEANPSAEVKRQIEEILAESGRQTQSSDMLRASRTLEVLEWIGTPEARKAIDPLTKEARSQWLRESVATSLGRYAKEND